MSHAAEGTRVQKHIGDPVGEQPAVPRAKLEQIFADLQSDLRFDHELNGCLNGGICTATCPAAHYYDFSPREIVQLLWTENLEGIYDAMQEKIWACAQCYTCAARCPFGNSPGGLVMLMRETAIKHQMKSAKDVLRPFSRVMLKLISTGNLGLLSTFTVDGRVAGRWRAARDGKGKKRAVLALEPFVKLAAAARRALEAEGQALLAFLEPELADRDLRFTS